MRKLEHREKYKRAKKELARRILTNKTESENRIKID